MPAGALLAAILAAMQAAPAAAEPVPSVMIVEVTKGRGGYLGAIVPDDPDELPWLSHIELRVRLRRHVAGPRYPARSQMEYVAHAPYVPGVRLLVVAEPRKREGASGFFVRWRTTADGRARDRFCVPERVIRELRIEAAFARAVRKVRDGTPHFCVTA